MRQQRSISLTITLGAISLVLSIAMLVGWIIVFVKNKMFMSHLAAHVWLLIAGIVSLLTISVVLVLFSLFLVREILEARRQESFIDSVTHELKTPLASLKLCLETMQRQNLKQEHREHLHRMMLRDVGRLSVFIDDILEASRVGQGQRAHVLEEIALHEFLVNIGSFIAERYSIENSCFDYDIEPSLRILIDKTWLDIIIKNLMDNAVKYSNEHVSVKISAFVEQEGIRILVQDFGIGIEMTHISRIFDRFYRGSEEAVRQRKGTGLGLFVVASLVRDMKGYISAHSNGSHQGTTFDLFLPCRVWFVE